jgi:hypothetical protein
MRLKVSLGTCPRPSGPWVARDDSDSLVPEFFQGGKHIHRRNKERYQHMQHFSINAASALLERTRKTITRALRHVPPDSHQRGQPRWSMAHIVAAVNQNADRPAAQHVVGGNRSNVDALEADFQALSKRYETTFKKLEALPTTAKRRAAATALVEFVVDDLLPAYRARDTADGLHPDHVLLRSDQMQRVIAGVLRIPCQLDRDAVWKMFIDAEVEDS